MTAAIATAPPVLPDLLGTSPADLIDHSARQDSTPDEARARAERLRAGIVRYAEMRQDIADAFACRDWLALDYQSWPAYVAGEFGEQLAQLALGDRRQAIADLRAQGMSTRQIAGATGVSQSTIRDDLKVSGVHSPETVTGSDGKQHPAKRPERPPFPGPAESLSAAQTAGPGPSPVPAANAPAPSQEPGGHLRLVPDPVTPPPGSPATWGPAEHEANRREVERKRAVEAAERFAKSLVLEVRGMIATIIDGLDCGAPIDLVTLDEIAECRAALDRLEARVTA